MYQIGERFAVIGEGETEPEGLVPIRLLPHFHHSAYPWWSESTAAVLAALPDDLSGKTVLDFGCGASCILGLAAHALGADVTALDHHPEIAEIARRQADGRFPVLMLDNGHDYDVILANIGDAHTVGTLASRAGLLIGTSKDGDLVG